MIGSLASSKIVQIGRRRAILLASLVSLGGAALQFIINFWTLFAGKIIYGASAAVLLTGGALYLSETLPPEKVGTHGFAVNFGVTLGISTILNVAIPVPDDDPDSKMWWAVALVPIALSIINLIIWSTWFRLEPLGYCL